MTQRGGAAGAGPEAAGPGVSGLSRRELAVARSLGSARARTEDRLQRFLDAALDLMREGEPGRDVTVQEVVDRSGQSLRLFYQFFGGKHELLLAMFEDVVRSTVAFLRGRVDEEDGALDRLHRFVVELHRLCRPAVGSAPADGIPSAWLLVDFAQQLLTRHAAEAARAFAPLTAYFGELLDEAAEAGAVRPGLRQSPVAGIFLEAVMFNTFSATIGGVPLRAGGSDAAEELWDVVLHGVGTGGRP